MGAGQVEAARRTAQLAPNELKVAVLLPDKTRAFELTREKEVMGEKPGAGLSEDPKHFAGMELYADGLVHFGDMQAKIAYGDLDGALNAARMTGPWGFFGRELLIAKVGQATLEAGDTDMAISIAMEVRNAEDSDRLVLKIVEHLCDEKDFDRAEGTARLIRNDDRRASGLAVIGDAVARFGATSEAARLFDESFDLLEAEAVFPDGKARRFLDLATVQFEAGLLADAKVSALRALELSWPRDAGEDAQSYESNLGFAGRAEIATLLSQLNALDRAVILRDEALAATAGPYVDQYDLQLALQVRVSLLKFGGPEVTASELRDIVMLLTLPQRHNFGGFVSIHNFDFVFAELAKRGLLRETIILSQITTWFGTTPFFSASRGYRSAADIDPAFVESALPLIFNDVAQNDARIIVAAAYAKRSQPKEVSRILRDVVAYAVGIKPRPTWFGVNDQTSQLGEAAGIYADMGFRHEARETITLAYALAKQLEEPGVQFKAYLAIGFLLLQKDALLAD